MSPSPLAGSPGEAIARPPAVSAVRPLASPDAPATPAILPALEPPVVPRDLVAAALLVAALREGPARAELAAELARAAAVGPAALAARVAALAGSGQPLATALAAAARAMPALGGLLPATPDGAIEPEPPPIDATVRLLGTPEVLDRAGRPVRWRLRRCLQLLAFLATSPGREASRDAIAAALWPGASEDVLRRNFHPTLSHLRRALGGAGTGSPIVLDRGGLYRLDPHRVWSVDVWEFEAATSEGRARLAQGDRGGARASWLRAWSLYHGELLSGIEDPWVVPRREELARLRARLLFDLGGLDAGDGRLVEAVDAYRALLAFEPLHEQAHVAVMTLYAQQGRRDLVRLQFHRLCTQLLEELGVEPLAETTAAYHRLMG